MSKERKEETRDTNEYVVKRNKQLSIINEKDGWLAYFASKMVEAYSCISLKLLRLTKL